MNDLAALSQAEWSVLYTDAFFLIALHFEFYLKSTYTFYLEKFLMDSENNEQGTKNASILPPRWKWKRGKMPKILTSVLHNIHNWCLSTLVQWHMILELAVDQNLFCFRSARSQNNAGAETNFLCETGELLTQHIPAHSNIENYSNLHCFEFWLKITRVVESASSAWSPSPSVSVQRRTRYSFYISHVRFQPCHIHISNSAMANKWIGYFPDNVLL